MFVRKTVTSMMSCHVAPASSKTSRTFSNTARHCASRAGTHPPARAPENFQTICSLLRCILLKLWQIRIHLVRRLCVGCPDVHFWFEQPRVVQARSEDALSLIRNAAEEARAAVGAKTSFVVTDHLARRGIVARCAFRDFEYFRGHIHDRRKRTARGALTVAAVTVKHRDRLSGAFVANRAASASAGEGVWHLVRCDCVPRQGKRQKRQNASPIVRELSKLQPRDLGEAHSSPKN